MAYSGKSVEGDKLTASNGYVYLGKEDEDGSWRFSRDSSTNNLKMEIRVTGVWELREEIGATNG